MKKSAKPYLEDILNSIFQIEEYFGDVDQKFESFIKDTKTQDSIIRRLEIIGEATKRLEEEFKQSYQDIPWKRMTGMRDVLIHDYDEADLEQIWQVIIDDLPILKDQILEILKLHE